MQRDAIIIGGGLSGLTAAALLAKRQLNVTIIEKNYNPGGSCGAFRRGDITFDQGSAMLYGFGENGYNAHRFVFNCLEEPIDMIRHDLLYCVNYSGRRVKFWADVDRFSQELSELFPHEKENIKRFYRDMFKMYRHVMVENPSYNTADETDPKTALKSILKHPMSYTRFLGYLNKSAESLLKKYFKDPGIFKFFDKLTSTYCYATVEEAPAVLAAVMFVDNHVGGSYYPAGSTLFLPGKLEKVIEENGGEMLLGREAVTLLFENGKPSGVLLDDGTRLEAPYIIYSGTVWNLYGKLIDEAHSSKKRRDWAAGLAPTYPSVVLYSVVDRDIIPEDTAPVEMLVGNPYRLDESEVTAYIFSIDDRTLCGDDEHTVVAIGPTFESWDTLDDAQYKNKKVKERERLISVLEKRFPGFSSAVRYADIATPKTIERYTMKNGGSVAGPKQMLGQHMFRRLHTRTEWGNFFCCGESTVMGTGTPTVTTSGISAANAVLNKLNMERFTYRRDMQNRVRLVNKPFMPGMLFEDCAEREREIMLKALRCRMCERPSCTDKADIRGIMRRTAVGNFTGAKKCWLKAPADSEALERFESNCICAREGGSAVDICGVIKYLTGET
ncbi:MAG: FAD-dependent oxidoreductase [Clostridiales bacterium]|nr:FAD-dependent oxidoreductase [Clostridiales bacterium]